MMGGQFAVVREVDGWQILAQKDTEEGQVVLRFSVWVGSDRVESCGVVLGGVSEEAIDRIIADLSGADEHGGWDMARRALEDAVQAAEDHHAG